MLARGGVNFAAISLICRNERPGSYAPYDLGMKEDIFIRDKNGQISIGEVCSIWALFTLFDILTVLCYQVAPPNFN